MMDLKESNRSKADRLERMQLGIMFWDYVLENPDFGLFVCTYDVNEKKFIEVGKSCEKILGYTDKEMEGRFFSDFVHPEDAEPTESVIQNDLLKNKEVSGFINRYRKKDGDYVIMTWYTGGFDGEKRFAFAEVRAMTEVCNVCADPILKALRVKLDPNLRRVNDD